MLSARWVYSTLPAPEQAPNADSWVHRPHLEAHTPVILAVVALGHSQAGIRPHCPPAINTTVPAGTWAVRGGQWLCFCSLNGFALYLWDVELVICVREEAEELQEIHAPSHL